MIITHENCKELNDNELVELSLKNLDYFSCLYQRYEHELLRYIGRISGFQAEESRDILQESFIKIWRNLKEYEQDLKFSSWMYRIVHNETISQIRKSRSFGKNRTSDAKHLENKIQDDQVADKEDKSLLAHKALELLPLKYKEVLVLKFLEEKSYEEISDILRIPEGTVAIRINRAKKKFREITENRFDLI